MKKYLLLFALSIVFISQQSRVFVRSSRDKQKYIIYLHGRIIEDKGIYAVHEEYGAYDYTGIVNALREQGFNVISEVRPPNTGNEYSDHVVNQVVL